jgi:H+-transporting ATPase
LTVTFIVDQIKRDGKWTNIDAALVVPGDLCLLAAGSTVPADTIINHGSVEIDQSALTGESLPVKMFKGSVAKMGSTVVKGEVESTVRHTGKNTFFGKTAALLQQQHELSNLQKLLIKIMSVLVVVSLILCAIVFTYLHENDMSVKDNLSFTVVLLVASIPIAIEIVCTTTLALGSKQLAKHGAIVTRLAAIEDLAGVSILCSDKTGTLTMNKMVIQSNPCVYWEGESQESLLLHAAMAAKWKEPPRDALDTMVLTQAKLEDLNDYVQLDYVPFDPRVKRTEGTLRAPNGLEFKVTKGAPNILLELCNNADIAARCKTDVHKLGESGTRCLAIAKTDSNGQWHMMGLLTFLDPERPDSKLTIEQALDNGVEVKMITGDHLLIAREMARRLGLGNAIYSAEGLPNLDADNKPPKDLVAKYGQKILMADGFAQVYPEHKFLIVETLRQYGYKIGMTGDGVNDAPALKRADVGIAVQGATDAARAAADIVLTKPGLSTIIHGLIMSRCIFVRMRSFLTYRIAATLQLLVFFFIAVLSFHPKDFNEDFDDFFHLPVLMLMLITLLNDGTLIAIGYDNVIPSRSPQIWNIPRLFTISIALAIFACGSSLLLLYWALDSWHTDSFLYKIGLGKVKYGQIICMMYLKVSVSDFLTLFASRAHNKFFWKSRPATILMGAAAVALSASTIVSTSWPYSHPDKIQTEGMGRSEPKLLPLFVWIYCIIWWILQDVFKVLVYQLLKRMHLFQNRKVQVANVNLCELTIIIAHLLLPKFILFFSISRTNSKFAID